MGEEKRHRICKTGIYKWDGEGLLGDFIEDTGWMNWAFDNQWFWGLQRWGQGTEAARMYLRHFSVSKRTELTKCAKTIPLLRIRSLKTFQAGEVHVGELKI